MTCRTETGKKNARSRSTRAKIKAASPLPKVEIGFLAL